MKLRARMLVSTVIALVLIQSTACLAAETKKVACVGDSITFGATIKDRANRSYPAQLGAMLGGEYEVRNFGVNGATLLKKGNKPYWKQKRYQEALAFQPDIVIIKLGTNDTKPGNWQHKAGFVTNYVEMVESFRKLESKPAVWVCYPVPAFPERWGISGETIKNEVMPLVNEVKAKTDVKVIDLHAALSGKGDLFPDKIHPNAEGARLMAETIKAAITATE